MQSVVNMKGKLTNGAGYFSLDKGYSIREINCLEEFKTLKSLWNDMASREKIFYPFLCFEWMEAFLEHFLDKDDLIVLIVFRGELPVCIAPFVLRHDRCKGILMRKIELIGNFYAHVRNLIFQNVENHEKEEGFFFLLEYLLRSKDWDVIDLQSIPEEEFEFEPLRQAAEKIGLAYQEYTCFGNWYLDRIECDSTEYLQSRSPNIRNNAKRYKKALERMGKLEVSIVTGGNEEEINRFMDHYYSVYWESWKKTETDHTFHRDIAKFACRKGWLRLGFLFFEGEPIAAQFWLVHGGVAHILKLVYKEQYRKYIPGIILTTEMMKYVIDIDKISILDFGIGDDPYKKDWTPKRRERKGVLICNKTAKGNLVFILADKILPIVNKHKYLRKMKSLIRDRIYGKTAAKRSRR